MTLIDRQIEAIAQACAVPVETVRSVIAGQRAEEGAGERVRAALSLIGFIAPIPLVAMPVSVNVPENAPRIIARSGVYRVGSLDDNEKTPPARLINPMRDWDCFNGVDDR